MTNIEKIKAEIERLRSESANRLGDAFGKNDVRLALSNGGAAWVCEQLLSFIDSLEPEPCIRKIYEFEVGDIIYVYENDDYYPSIIRLPEGFRTEDYFTCDMLVLEKKQCNAYPQATFTVVDDNCLCRLATKAELDLFSNYFDVNKIKKKHE